MKLAEQAEAVTGRTLRFGTSGIPRSSARPSTESGIRRAGELGLGCLEMAWGNGVRMSDETAARIAVAARETGLHLTAHAPYFVNLCGDAEVRARSIARLVEAGSLAARCGAHSFCFHPGFYQGQDAHHASVKVWRALLEVTARLRDLGAIVDVRPELTGKPSQVGAFEDVLTWCEMIPGVHPCIDFSHHYARLGGAPNRREDFLGLLDEIERRLGAEALARLHVHIAGIEFGPAGEKRHLPLRRSAFAFRELLMALYERGVTGWAICESPELEDDALHLVEIWQSLT
ncbi:MAG: TIM barrel protein [Candidatus Eisenbacteria bacterium]